MKKKLIRQRSIVSRGHVEIDGPTRVSGFAIVGGNLIVNGDFECVGPLMCMGEITIRGNLKCGDIVIAGCGVEVSGDMNANRIKVWSGFSSDSDFETVAENIFARMPKPPKKSDDFLSPCDHLVDESVISEITGERSYALDVKGDISCGDVVAKGQIHAGGRFNPDDLDALGFPVEASWIHIEGDCFCGDLSARGEITVEGNLDCVWVECMRLRVWGDANVHQTILVTSSDRRKDDDDPQPLHASVAYDMECGLDPMELVALEDLRASLECGSITAGTVNAAGSIRSEMHITCEGYLKANRSIIAGGAINTGKEYGVLAGIGVPRNRWLAYGYVCAPDKPPRILTGVFRVLGRRRGAVLKPARLPKQR